MGNNDDSIWHAVRFSLPIALIVWAVLIWIVLTCSVMYEHIASQCDKTCRTHHLSKSIGH